MYCSECGTKNDTDSLFCSECGHKLEKEEEKETKKKTKTKKEEEKPSKKAPKEDNELKEPAKKMSKKTKVCLIVIILLIALMAVGYKIGSDLTNPKTIAKDYVEAVINNNSNKLYNYLEIEGDKTFVSKKIFKEVMKKETEESKIENYKIKDVTYSDLNAKVNFVYQVKGSKTEQKGTVELTKQKGKKYLIFDNYKISNDTYKSIIIKDYTIKVLKGSVVSFANIKLTDKYLNKDKSDSEYDVYVLPQVFKYETKIKVELENGFEVEDKVTPSTYYNTYTIKLDENNLSEATKNELLESGKKILTDLYTDAIAGKKFADIKEKYEHKGLNLNNLETNYNEFVDDLTASSNKLKTISFKNITLYDLELNDDGDFEVEFKVNFDYTVDYETYNNELKTIDKTTYAYMTLILKYEDSKFYLKDFDDLKTYFSRY